jgi:hypothetical protein
MKSPLLAALVLACSAAAFAQTDTVCPWFSTGSAAKVLGGEVTSVVQATGNWSGSCVFTRKSANTMKMLEILVGKDNTHPCPEGSSQVGALGNEAVQCRRKGEQGQQENTIAGRVRSVFFVVSMTDGRPASQTYPDARQPDPNAASELERIAEQVTGNLF